MKYALKYKQPAENSDYGWEHHSLPIGNSYMGANIFGIVNRDRIQITENSLQNPGHLGGLNSFANIFLHFKHNNIADYERGLCLNDSIAYCKYKYRGNLFTREYFTSYPNNVLVIRLESEKRKKLTFNITAEIPFIKNYAIEKNDGAKKTGSVSYSNNRININGKMHYYNIHFSGLIHIDCHGGKIESQKDSISIKNADNATIYICIGTNYSLNKSIFLENDPHKKLRNTSPKLKIARRMDQLLKKNYLEIKKRHIEDYHKLFNRVDLILGDYREEPTDQLLKRYSQGENILYLEMLYFQYGRYLLISSSRKGGYPSNLQGTWNCHDFSPWGSGYWHNINVQMNYWPSFVTNIAETFEPYIEFYQAFREKAEIFASEYIEKNNPDNYSSINGECGWTIGTAAYPYKISPPGGHSGPGTGGLTTKLFWDYYSFTMDSKILKEVTYPSLLSMSKFLTKTVKNYDGEYLTTFSASPEQMLNREYVDKGIYYQTIGCAFDQQMIYENGKDFLKSSDLLLQVNEQYQIQKEQLDRYNPVLIGWSGQVKEFSEEKFYGEIGEYKHRHISQLVGLYPGTLINSSTMAWIDAAKITLQERGDNSTGWALAHRLNLWARVFDGNQCHKLLRTLIGEKTMENLWDTHPPFQIDGNFGGTAGIAEMILQSHEDYIRILPALPVNWKSGEFKGLVARGNFHISVKWESGFATELLIKSNYGGICRLKYNNLSSGVLKTINGDQINFKVSNRDDIFFNTEPEHIYKITDIKSQVKTNIPTGFKIDNKTLKLEWESEVGTEYNIYRAVNNSPTYEQVIANYSGNHYLDKNLDFPSVERATYRLTATKSGLSESDGCVVAINHATTLDKDRYNVNINFRW